jgi:hypothetical protein
MITSGMMSSNTPEWATPQSFFDMLNREFSFTLDPCCTHENAKCLKHYTKDDDGLSKNWGGRKCFVILHMAESCLNGLRNAMMKADTQMWLCSFPQGLIQDGFTITSMARLR